MHQKEEAALLKKIRKMMILQAVDHIHSDHMNYMIGISRFRYSFRKDVGGPALIGNLICGGRASDGLAQFVFKEKQRRKAFPFQRTLGYGNPKCRKALTSVAKTGETRSYPQVSQSHRDQKCQEH
ncbi:hypothetical protein RND71_036753 [Anisodus tanguticus]|uniref:Uncharacterized protein n=1 Tax=Anisodus tanguticus TaxID=243964 RepID=A0AAE1V052_9SOLA|nr:hypothetical protein RND71_036753 [Anisodus tanguticus]